MLGDVKDHKLVIKDNSLKESGELEKRTVDEEITSRSAQLKLN